MKKLMIFYFVLLASFLMAQPLMAAEEIGGVHQADGTDVATGFRWDHCQQTYHAVGSSRTYCYMESQRVWVWTTDDRAEQVLIACAESNHWCGVNFTSTTGTWNYIKMYKY